MNSLQTRRPDDIAPADRDVNISSCQLSMFDDDKSWGTNERQAGREEDRNAIVETVEKVKAKKL